MGVGCSANGWSAVGSALANSTLAGVLAGFMINGIVLVLGNKPTEMKAEYVRGLSLLFAAFIALGFDAFLFGLVTGDSTSDSVSACRRAWTEAMLGAGLLAVGTVAIIAGFVYLFSAYFGSPQAEWKDSVDMLKTLCNVVRVGVAVAIVACLYMTTRSYLYAIYGGSIPQAEGYLLYEYVAYGLGIVWFVFYALRSHSFDNRVSQLVRANTNQGLFTALKIGIYASVIYTLLSAVAATMVATSSSSFWYPIDWRVRFIIIVTATWVSLISLIPLVFLLGSAVPPFGQPLLPNRPGEGAPADASSSQDPSPPEMASPPPPS
jgi:hypothetical protein